VVVTRSPGAIAITPNGKVAYVTDVLGISVTPIQITTSKAGKSIPVGGQPSGIAIVP
jgi:DNA-binding beta-propeller fold protein YncE